jgi:hypothetical protein
MGFLKKAAREEDSSQESDGLEEQYMKLFPKIGRDFVHKEDLAAMLGTIMFLLDPLGLNPLDTGDDSEARERAKEYKAYLDKDKKGSDVYRDLINLDEDE